MPPTREAIIDIWQSYTDTYTAIRGNDFKDNVENGIVDRVGLELSSLRDDDEKDSEDEPPNIVSELTVKLLADEVTSWLFTPQWSGQAASEERKWITSRGTIIRNIGGHIISVDTEGPFFVHIGIAHSNNNGVDIYVHHNNVEHEEADAKL